MENEIELKLWVESDATSVIEQDLLPALDVKAPYREFALQNQYFDTPDKTLRKHRIGLRLRSHDGKFQQTIKTKGTAIGGLHQRPEFNVDLPSAQLKLDLFDSAVWPVDLSISRLEARLKPIFTTDFMRREYTLQFADDSIVELVYDRGNIKAGEQQASINEIELELKQGHVSKLFDVAELLSEQMTCQVGNLSKAARGYMLVDGRSSKARQLLSELDITAQDSCEEGFEKATVYALEHWQHHELCYQNSGKIKDLKGMLEGMRLCFQALALYLPSLQCPQLLSLHKSMLLWLNQWYWLEQAIGTKELRSSRGPYRKLAKNDDLMSYLRGLNEGLISRHAPLDKIRSSTNVGMQLGLSRALIEKPWQNASDSYHSKLSEHARGWLSQGWQNIQQSIPLNKDMTAQDYLFHQTMLRQTLNIGFLLGNLFANDQKQFRAPWLDLLNGIEELKTLVFLRQQLSQSDIEGKDELLEWNDQKITSLLSVMEKTRDAAVHAEVYWQ